MRRRTALPPFFIVSADPHPCPYLPGKTACTPLRWPRTPLTSADFDRLLAEGDRRAGPVLYRTECPSCTACEPLRLPVHRLELTKSQRRVLRRNEDLRIEIGAPISSPERVELYNRHRDERGLARTDGPINTAEYHLQYVESCVDTREIDYYAGDRLIAVSIVDLGAHAASSVYHYFDPGESWRSLGVFSVIKEVQLCQEWQLDWYYMGLWVGDCSNLSYKSNYYPHQRRRDGVWREYRHDGSVIELDPKEEGGE